MSLIFAYLVDQHRQTELDDKTRKLRDKLAESYFGKTVKTDAYANSKKSRATYILHEKRPHWFIWDYFEAADKGYWGYMLASPIVANSKKLAQKLALQQCRKRNNGLAGFIPLMGKAADDVLFPELERSAGFKVWRQNSIHSFDNNMAYWIRHGPPAPEKIGNFRIFSHLGKDSDSLAIFLSPIPRLSAKPLWMHILNYIVVLACLLMIIRGLLINRWFETRLTIRFLLLYFLATTFPLGLLAVSAAAYSYQSEHSAKNQIELDLENCLRQFSTTKLQIQEDYKKAAQELFADKNLAAMIAKNGIKSEEIKEKILKRFAQGDEKLPLLGFYLLDLNGRGLECAQDASPAQMDHIFGIYRSSLIDNLRKLHLKQNPEAELAEFAISEEEKFGAQSFSSVSGNDFSVELEKRRNFCISQQSGDSTASLIYDYINVAGLPQAILFLVWDDNPLFEKSIPKTIRNFKTQFPRFSFIAFKNTPQGLAPLFRPKDELDGLFFNRVAQVAEIASTRGSVSKSHLSASSIVALPFGVNSEIVVAGFSRHDDIVAVSVYRNLVFIFLILLSLLIAVVCAYFAAAFLLKPVAELRSAVARVADGDFSVNIHSQRPDELGNLTREFARMVQGLRERHRLASLLSDHALEALFSDSGSNAVQDARKIHGVALVSDIRGFTTLCETHSTDEITELLNFHFAIVSQVVSDNGGRIYKFIGDAIEAVFEEEDTEKACLNALRAAVEICAANNLINQKRKAEGQFAYALGVGLALGDFFAGPVGSPDTRLDYSIIGETFTRAAELEALSKKCRNLPVVFDELIAELLGKKCLVEPLDRFYCLSGADDFSKGLVCEYQLPIGSQADSPATADEKEIDSTNSGFFARNLHKTLFATFVVFLLLTCLATFQGFMLRNQKLKSFNKNQARQHLLSFSHQLKSEDAGKVAFENLMRNMIFRMEDEIGLQYQQDESQKLVRQVKSTIDELTTQGVKPTRVFVSSCLPDVADGAVKTIFKQGVADEHARLFHQLSHYLSAGYQSVYQTISEPVFVKELEARMAELFGANISSNYIYFGGIGRAMRVMNNCEPELFYWYFVRGLPEKHFARKLPEENYELSVPGKPNYRIAAIVIFAVAEKDCKESPALLAKAYDDTYNSLALKDAKGKVFAGPGFPEYLMASSAANGDDNQILLNSDSLTLGQKNYELSIARHLQTEGQSDLRLVTVFLLLVFIALSFYVYRSIFEKTMLTVKIRSKLVFSVLLTAIIPMLTVAFVANLFLFENHQAMLHQQRIEMQRFIEGFEVRQFYNQLRITGRMERFSRQPEVLRLARLIDEEKDVKKNSEALQKLFAGYFKQITLPEDWTSNAIAREAILVSINNLELQLGSNSNNSSGKKSVLSLVLTQLARHILSQVISDTQAVELNMKDLKNEMFFESSMKSLRSNFGDEAYIQTNAALGKLVEFEGTSGAVGIYTVLLPSIDDPQFAIIWLVSLTRGSFLTSLAARNLGPFAIFAIEKQKYGMLERKFRPYEGLPVNKASSWLAASNMPVSFVAELADDSISIEGRPGMQQYNSLLIGAARQKPIFALTTVISFTFIIFMGLALFIFVVIGYQTASEIMLPVEALTEGMRQIRLSNYGFRINEDRQDELGQLCNAYDNFARHLGEKEAMSRMLSHSAKHAAASDSSDFYGSSRREFVFLFIGSPGFAGQLSGNSVDKLFALLKQQVSGLCRIILEQGGDIDKLMGDKILAVFPVSAQDKLGAAACAMKVVRNILQADKLSEFPFPVAIGVNSGEVISGVVGYGAKRDFTVIGDAVNVSARIQKAAEELAEARCLFSWTFVELCADATDFNLHSEVSLKGKSQQFKLYKLNERS